MKPNVTKLVVCDPRRNALLQLNGWRGSVEPVRQWEPSHPFFPFPLPLASIGEEKAKCQEESLTPYLLSFLAVRCPAIVSASSSSISRGRDKAYYRDRQIWSNGETGPNQESRPRW